MLSQQSGGRSRSLLSYHGLEQRARLLDERKAPIPGKRGAGRRPSARCGGASPAVPRCPITSGSRDLPPIEEKLFKEDLSGIYSKVGVCGGLGPSRAAGWQPLSGTQRGGGW